MKEYTIQVQFLTIYFDDVMEVLHALDKDVDYQLPGGDFATKTIAVARRDATESFDLITQKVKERLFIGASIHIGHEI